MDEVEGRGHLIVHSALDVRAHVQGIDDTGFAHAVELRMRDARSRRPSVTPA